MTQEVRPLAQIVPRTDGGDLVFEVGEREVRVEGDRDTVWRVLGLCDGRRTRPQVVEAAGPDTADLVDALLAQGVLVDGPDVWRRWHELGSLRRGLISRVDDATLAGLTRERYAPEQEPATSHAVDDPGTQVFGLGSRRCSATAAPEPRQVTHAEVCAVLSGMYQEQARPVPSGGAMYSLILHLALRDPLGPLGPGVWWYDPEGALRLVSPGRPDLQPLFLRHPVTDALLERDHPVVFVSADISRVGRKYSGKAYRLVLMEAGASMQNAYLTGAELNLGVRAVAGIDERGVGVMLGLPEGTAPLLALLLGS